MDEVHRTRLTPPAPAPGMNGTPVPNGRVVGGAASAKRRPGPAVGSLCDQCSALCCRYVALPIDTPESASDYDSIRWYLAHENIHVFVDDGEWYIAFATRCKNLMEDNRCGIYETRPRICRGYDTSNCEYHGEEYRYELMFTSADQIQRYAEKELGRSILFKARPKKLKLRRGRNGTRRVELPIA